MRVVYLIKRTNGNFDLLIVKRLAFWQLHQRSRVTFRCNLHGPSKILDLLSQLQRLCLKFNDLGRNILSLLVGELFYKLRPLHAEHI